MAAASGGSHCVSCCLPFLIGGVFAPCIWGCDRQRVIQRFNISPAEDGCSSCLLVCICPWCALIQVSTASALARRRERVRSRRQRAVPAHPSPALVRSAGPVGVSVPRPPSLPVITTTHARLQRPCSPRPPAQELNHIQANSYGQGGGGQTTVVVASPQPQYMMPSPQINLNVSNNNNNNNNSNNNNNNNMMMMSPYSAAMGPSPMHQGMASPGGGYYPQQPSPGGGYPQQPQFNPYAQQQPGMGYPPQQQNSMGYPPQQHNV